MIYPEKAYIAAGQALARAATEQATKARARIIDLMTSTEQPADQPRARELAASGEGEPPGLGAARPHFFLQAARLIRAGRFSKTQPTHTENQNVPPAKQPTHTGLRFQHSRDHA